LVSCASNLQEEGSSLSIADSTAVVFYSCIGLGISITPIAISHRILILAISLTGAILFWSYSAGLVSFLTVEKIDYPIKSYKVSGHYGSIL
jgi:hypothetical protein